ncbi:MAG: CRTAC1 family protein [Thermoanaerobaculia bacterium]
MLIGATAPAGAALRFVDRAAQAGLTAPTWCGRPEKPHILESGGTGLGLVDVDGDGDLDLYLVNGWRLEGSEVAERGRDLLYRNEGDGRFVEATDRAGLGQDGWGTGIAAGDVDGDGLVDLFVGNFGPDVLYRNRGDGTFERIEPGPGLDGWTGGAVLFDADGDGDEDLFVGGYIDCTLEEVLAQRPRLLWEGMQVMMGPFGLEGLGNRYFENTEGGSFREATAAAGLTDAGLYYTFGVAAADLDGDLDLDLYAANDSNPNYLYENDGAGRFREVGLWSGAALDAAGNGQAGMGLAVADLDGDGLPEVLVTNFWKDVSTLYRNLGSMAFEDATRAVGLDGPTYLPLSWGAALADLDGDGDRDLLIADGHIYPQADEAASAGTTYRQRNLLLENRDGRFVEVEGGPGLAVEESSRGLALGDVDGDGDLDAAISNVDAPPTLLLNETDGAGAWLRLDAPGALRVAVETASRRQVLHRVRGGSFLSVSEETFHAGLGEAASATVEVTWPGGRARRLVDLPARRLAVIPRP